MAKQIQLELEIGANFSAAITLDTTQTGRTHRADIRVTVGDVTVKVAFRTSPSSGQGTITLAGDIVTLIAGADITELLNLSTDSAFWVIDVESIGATAADIRREARGLVLVTRDITRLSEPTAAANASGLVSFTDVQTLTSTQQSQARDNIGAGTGAANLTGHITSTGNTAVLGSFTLAQLNAAISDADVGGGMAIGGAVAGATAGQILYTTAGPVLANSTAISYASELFKVESAGDPKIVVQKTGQQFATLFAGSSLSLFQFRDKFGIQSATSINDFGSAQYAQMVFGSTRNTAFGDMGSGESDPGARVGIYTHATTRIGLIIQLMASQTAAAWEVKNSGGTVTASVSAAGNLFAQTTRTQSYTVATLPSGVVATRTFVTDETTGAFRGTCVGSGAIETPVHYANGAWKNG